MKGTIVTLDGLDDGTIWPDGEFEVISDVFFARAELDLTTGKAQRWPFNGEGYVRVKPLDPKVYRRWTRRSGGFLVVPVTHTKEVSSGSEGGNVPS